LRSAAGSQHPTAAKGRHGDNHQCGRHAETFCSLKIAEMEVRMSPEICAGQGCHRRFGAEGAHLTVVGRLAELSSPPAEEDAHHEGDGKPCQRRLPHTSGENIKRHAGLFCGYDRLAQALRCRLDTVDHLLDGRWSFRRSEVIGHDQ
jgi:hypothetical protein